MKHRKPLQSLIKIERDRQVKQEIGEEMEELEATGQESETKAAKWVMEKGDERRTEEQKIEDIKNEILTDSRRKKKEYIQTLLNLFLVEMQKFHDDLPKDCGWWVRPTDDGVVMVLKVKDSWYRRATRASGEVKYDLNAVHRFISQALILANPEEKESPIWTPHSRMVN